MPRPEDGEKGQLPVFTDKIWAAGLKAHAWSLEHNTRDLRAATLDLPANGKI